MIRKYGPAVGAAILVAGLAIASGLVDQGAPGKQGPWPVGTTPLTCTSPTHKVTSVGVAAGSCPSSQLTSRRSIQLCNSIENTGNPLIKIRVDGTNPTMGTSNVGDVLAPGDCITYPIGSTVTPKCISDTAATALTSLECI